MTDYSLYGLVNAYNEHMKESYNNPQQQQAANIVGMTFGFFVFMLLANIVIWILAIVLLIKYWGVLPSWAKVLGLLGILPIFPFGPLLTIIVVLVAKSQE
jgi:hypothetical protein